MSDLDALSRDLLLVPTRTLARKSGEDPRRIRLLGPRALIIAAVLQRFGLGECTVVPAGVRDGMVLAAAAAPDAWWQEAPP
jgi:hypothetical protein